jgi:hypothetical protein
LQPSGIVSLIFRSGWQRRVMLLRSAIRKTFLRN